MGQKLGLCLVGTYKSRSLKNRARRAARINQAERLFTPRGQISPQSCAEISTQVEIINNGNLDEYNNENKLQSLIYEDVYKGDRTILSNCKIYCNFCFYIDKN